MTYEEMVNDILLYIKKNNLNSISLLGHSMVMIIFYKI